MRRLLHALHNEKTCDYLFQSEDFNDWVITTAFYSALHLVYNELFPMKMNNVIFPDFDRYYKALPPFRESKHTETLNLVRQRLPVYIEYKWLYDTCMVARYANCNLSRSKACQARDNLSSIRESLSKSNSIE